MSSIRESSQAYGFVVERKSFHGFKIPFDETIAQLIFQHVADTSILSNTWSARSSKTPPPKRRSSSQILSRKYLLNSLLTKGLRLVNREWNRFLAPLLYHTIHLSSATQAACLLSSLQLTPSLRYLTNSLTVTIPQTHGIPDHEAHPDRRILRKLFQKNLPQLKHLHLYTSTFYDSMTFLKDSLRGRISLMQLVVVCDGPCITMSTGYIWSILREFPRLEEFWFEFVGDDGKCKTIRKIPMDLICLSMRKLGISGALLDDETVERLTLICPLLDELEIDGQNRFCTI